jgi:uncharacterized protein (TIGR02391 family)
MTAALDPPLGSDLNAEQRRVLQTIYDTWTKDVQWPLVPWIDSVIDQEHGLDLQKILPTMPERYLLFNRYSPTSGELKLTVAGMACCDGPAGDVQLFMRTLRWCVDHEKAFRPSDPTKEETLTLSAAQAKEEWTAAGGEASPRILKKALALADVEQIHGGWTWSGQDPAEWSVTITPRIRPYGDARSFEDYLAIKEQLRREAIAQTPIISTPPRLVQRGFAASVPLAGGSALDALVPPFLPTAEEDQQQDDDDHDQEGEADHGDRVTLHLTDVHPLVGEACRDLINSGYNRQGVHEAFLALRDHVRSITGISDSNDATLMGKAFGGDHPQLLVVTNLTDDNDRNIQRGTAHLAAALCALVRNPLAHTSSQPDPKEAMRMLAIIDLVMRRVEARPTATSSPPPATEATVDAD